MTEEAKVISIDGKDYSQSDLNDKQNYLVNQIEDLQRKSAQLRFQLDQVTIAQNAFTQELINSMKEETKDEVTQ